MERFFHIRTKDYDFTPYRLNGIQEAFDRNKTNYDIILKARQLGSSTYNVLDALARTICIPNFQAAIVAHEKPATERLFMTVSRALAGMPEWDEAGNAVRPKPGHDRTDYIDFPKLQSSIYIGTAGSRRFGRSETINFLLLSEVPQWEPTDRHEFLTGVLESVPKGGRCVWESTPHGIGDEFHQLFLDAQSGVSNYKAHFFPWFSNPEFSLDEGVAEALPADRGPIVPTDEEMALMMKNNLTFGQLRWRRWKIQSQKRLFFQEYPEDSVSCFLATETTVFSQDALLLLLQEARPAGRIEKDGQLHIWRNPNAIRRYYIGADPSGGETSGDPASATVIDEDGREVASLWGHIPPPEFARLCVEVASMFHGALLGFERDSGRGQYCMDVANELGYSNLYRHFETGRVRYDSIPPLGYPASKPAKMKAIEDMKAALVAGDFRTENQETIRELLEYRFSSRTGKYGAPPGRHDDRATSTMIAWQMMESAPRQMGTVSGSSMLLYPAGVKR